SHADTARGARFPGRYDGFRALEGGTGECTGGGAQELPQAEPPVYRRGREEYAGGVWQAWPCIGGSGGRYRGLCEEVRPRRIFTAKRRGGNAEFQAKT